MIRLFSLSFLALVAGCSSGSNGTTSTSTVSAKTIAGVCAKLNSLSCAQPNCAETLDLAQSRCSDSEFQGLLDCMSIATISCGGSKNIPQVPQCDADIQRVNTCASEVHPIDGNPPVGPGSLPDASAPQCAADADCTEWTCMCSDGQDVTLSECKSGKCTDPVSLCAHASAAAQAACKDHGGPS